MTPGRCRPRTSSDPAYPSGTRRVLSRLPDYAPRVLTRGCMEAVA
ncbi:hypothetical protein FHW69_002430 [Luteibacter sp. Sphag1AF]|nr:hypothetical protein [Luteibacter sp. Sphag1AF]